MFKIKLLLEKQENIMLEKSAEEKRIKQEKENEDNKKLTLMLNNEFKTTQNTEVPMDDQINDLSKYNFQKNSTNLQMMGSDLNKNISKTNQIFNKISFKNRGIDDFGGDENAVSEVDKRKQEIDHLIGDFIVYKFLKLQIHINRINFNFQSF